MDAKSALEAVAAIRNAVPQDELVGFDGELMARYGVAEALGPLATTATVEAANVETTETITTDTEPLHESLIGGFSAAYNSYSRLVADANTRRAAGRGKKPEQLPLADAATVRAEVATLLETPGVVAELQASIDYFTAHPEVDSPKPGFDVKIIPEGLTPADNQATAQRLQQAVNPRFRSPYIRPEAYNDQRTPTTTGKGYQIVFAPRHYNVPSGTTAVQTKWQQAQNQSSQATELQTASDEVALVVINGLQASGQLADPSTRFDRSYYRRFDQAPHDDYVSSVYVNDGGRLVLDGSNVRNGNPARALVVPKA